MQVLQTASAMRRACRKARLEHVGADLLGVVPTMGALHAGHLSLVERARKECGLVAATIFVNPLQFGPGEDFARYPREPRHDLPLLESAGVDLLFMPGVEEMYPSGAETIVDVGSLGNRLDGIHRLGHFRGVTTVVAKLLHIVEPDRAYFGQKDAVQVAVLRKMVLDLNFELDLVVCPIVRDPDGLAMSSRNTYLSVAERKQALALPRALDAIEAAVRDGDRLWSSVQKAGQSVLRREPGVRLEYLEAVDAASLEPAKVLNPGTLVAVAGIVGKTRLIDNFLAP